MFNKRKLEIVGWVSIGAVLPLFAAFVGFYLYVKKPKVVYYEFNDEVTKENCDWKYRMMPCEMSDYICEMCVELEIDSDMAVAILIRENPEFNPNVTHKNENGTIDLGLWQLNDKYLYRVFIDRYWKIPVEFNPFNWKMNTYIALHHIKYLQNEMKVFDDIICSYNCGEGNVMRRSIPTSTYQYLAYVKNMYNLLKDQGYHKDF